MLVDCECVMVQGVFLRYLSDISEFLQGVFLRYLSDISACCVL